MKGLGRISLIVCVAFWLFLSTAPMWLAHAQTPQHFNAFAWTLSTSTGVTTQKVRRSLVAGGPYTILATVSSTITTYQDTDVSQGTNHCYVVSALIGANESPFSKEVCTVDAGTNVNPPTAPVVTAQ